MNTKTYTPTSLFGSSAPQSAQPLVVSNSSIVNDESAPIVARFQLSKITDQDVILYASEEQKLIGGALDPILESITKESSPVIFELFKKIQKGVDEADIPALQLEIQNSMGHAWYHGLLDALKLSSVAKRLEKSGERISSLLTSKSTSLKSLTDSMQDQIIAETGKLINDSKNIQALGEGYKKTILAIKPYTQASPEILATAKSELQLLKGKNPTDNIEIQEIKKFEDRISLFESRALVIDTVYAKAPAQLETIRLVLGASMTTLAECANSSMSEIIDIKSSLIEMAATHQIETVQIMGEQRRKLRDSLQTHSGNTLQKVAVNAAKSVGENRLADATKLLEKATKIKETTQKVLDERNNSKEKFAQARLKLEETKKLING